MSNGRDRGPSVTLRDVGSALERLEAATLTQLAAELSASPREVGVLLDFWERRGDVRRCDLQATTACGTSCTACPIGTSRTSTRATIVYEWVTPRSRGGTFW